MSSPPDSAPGALEVSGLYAFYGKSTVIHDVSLSVRQGEILTLLGRNGAGKTSMLMALAGVVGSHARSLRIDGREIGRLPSYKRARVGLALVPSGSRSFANLTVEENLTIVRRRENTSRPQMTIEDVYHAFPTLAKLKKSPGGKLSGGERQLLAVGRALMSAPKVLLLDEPSEGLAPLVVRGIGEILRGLAANGLSVILAEQNWRLALDTAHRACFLEKGHIVWEGTRDDARSHDVINRYLGV